MGGIACSQCATPFSPSRPRAGGPALASACGGPPAAWTAALRRAPAGRAIPPESSSRVLAMNAQTLTSPVVASLVSDAERLLVLPRHFGSRLLFAETAFFDWLRDLSPDYRGGYWHFYELSNGGFYMAPDMSERLRIEVVGNGYRGRMSADAAGITACLFAYSHLSFRFRTESFGNHYGWLLDFAADHAEARAILAAAD